MIVDRLDIDAAAFEQATGWKIKPEGACKGDVCVPLDRSAGAGFNLVAAAERLGMAIVADTDAGLWSIGPASLGGRDRAPRAASRILTPGARPDSIRALFSF